MNIIYGLFQSLFIAFIPLLIVALGGLVTEKSGVTNIALEGLMIFGAFIGAYVLKGMVAAGTSIQISYLTAIIVAGLAGCLLSLLHAVAAIKFNADQIISATAINIIAPAFAIFVARTISQAGQQIQFGANMVISEVPLLSQIPIIGDIFFKQTYISNLLGIVILAVVWIMLMKTRLGLHIRAVGENPHAAQSVGINIFKVRYISVAISGLLAGMGGLIFVATTSSEFNAQVAGFGFLAIAVLIFGNWSPGRIFITALFFAFLRTLSAVYTTIPILQDINIHKHFYDMLPYVAVMIVLVFFSKRSKAPSAAGKPFYQGER